MKRKFLAFELTKSNIDAVNTWLEENPEAKVLDFKVIHQGEWHAKVLALFEMPIWEDISYEQLYGIEDREDENK